MLTYFVTLNWNSTDLLKILFRTVVETTPEPHRWIVVDNGSDEKNRAALRQFLSETTETVAVAEVFPENKGCIVAHNWALNWAQGREDKQPYEVVLFDTDVEVTEKGWLTKAREWADKRPQIGIVGLEHGPDDKCGGAVFQDNRGTWYLHAQQLLNCEPCPAESVGFGFALLRWPVLKARIRFDKKYRFYYKQDADFCFQARVKGFEVWAFPVGNIHWGSGALAANRYHLGEAKGHAQVQKIKRANQKYFARKWKRFLDAKRANLLIDLKRLKRVNKQMAKGR